MPRSFQSLNLFSITVLGLVLMTGTTVTVTSAEKSKFNRRVNIGDAAPDWRDLKGVDDQMHSLSDYADDKILVLMFTCNHCPVAKSYEARVKSLVDEYAEQGVKIVAISCSKFPADSLEKMKNRAESEKFNFDYVQDLSQQTGLIYGASVTPQIFVLDEQRHIAYMGAIDDNMQVAKVKHHYLKDALDALLAGTPLEITETKPKGCEIEYE
ncbi:MAG: thioredoxin family protein [Planctomycetaceae bacterium]